MVKYFQKYYLVTVVTLIRFLSTVSSLVSLHVIFLDESHSTLITTEGLFTCMKGKEKDIR